MAPSAPAGESPISSGPIPRADILALVVRTATRHEANRAIAAAGLDRRAWHALFLAMIQAESGFNPHAISPKGAIGLGQLMPETARHLGVDPFRPDENLDGAARYLLAQLARFRDSDLALAAYNAGPERVNHYAGIPPFAETRAYIARVNHLRGASSPAAHETRSEPQAASASGWSPLLLTLN